MKNMKKKNMIIIVSSLTLISILVILTIISNTPGQTTELEITSSGNIIIPKNEITKTASFFPYESNGTYMEIIAIRANDNTVRTAFNTCQVCYSSGRGFYEQLGDVLICNNCGNQFTIDQIEKIKGGCNPVPILPEMKTESDSQIEIASEALDYYQPLFANWKR